MVVCNCEIHRSQYLRSSFGDLLRIPGPVPLVLAPSCEPSFCAVYSNGCPPVLMAAIQG